MAKDKKTNVNENTGISKSKAKREQRRKEVARDKKKQLISRIITTAVICAIIAVFVFFAGKSIYLAAIRTTSSSDMSAGLTADGKIDGVNVSESVTLADYENITIPDDEVNTDEQVQKDIDDLLSEYKEISNDVSLEIADGDEVSIDYVGTIDGVEFDGGNSNNAGYDLTIGSGSFVDDFEQQLIGSHPGDNVSVEVTFPDDYSSEDVAGKDAVFAVTINGIYRAAEFNDEFLEKNSLTTDEITTADEYRASLADKYYEENLENFLSDYILENSTVNTYPKNYLNIMKSVTKNNDESTASYYNQMFSSYGMESYSNLWDMTGDKNELEYEKSLTERAKETVKQAMVYQAIFEKAGLTIDMEAAKAEMNEENGDDTYADTVLQSYGEGYMAQNEIHDAVTEYLMELYK